MKVPLYKQSKMTCGPACLKMVLAYFNKNISEKEIIKEIGGIKKYGVRMIKLADLARKLNFKVECLSYNKKLAQGKAKIKEPNKADILKYLRKNIPVILAVNSRILSNKQNKNPKLGHFIVITKYQNKNFWYNNPQDGKQHKIKEDELLFAWHNNILNSSGYFLAIWQ